MTENTKKKTLEKIPVKATIIGVVALVVLLIGGLLLGKALNRGPRLSTISKASLEKVIEINDVSTLNYTYNAVATVYKKDSDKVKYYVAYDGTVTAGIDITKVDIQVSEGAKEIAVVIPKAEVQSVSVDMGSMEFIFEKDHYETETISQEAYKVCLEDLKTRASETVDLLELARENAIGAMKALIEPWIAQVDGEYKVEFK